MSDLRRLRIELLNAALAAHAARAPEALQVRLAFALLDLTRAQLGGEIDEMAVLRAEAALADWLGLAGGAEAAQS